MDFENLKPIMEGQANKIDVAIATLGLAGAVIGGTIIGNEKKPTHAKYIWTLDVEQVNPRQPGKAGLGDLNRALVDTLGIQVRWQLSDTSLVVIMPLNGREG